MTQMDLFPQPTPSKPSLQPVIPASPLATQVSASDIRMTATSGRTSCKLLHTKDPLSAFSKTFMVTSRWASTKCYLTWKVKATPQGRLLFQLAPSMRPTEETESSLLPTPRSCTAMSASNIQNRVNDKHPNLETVVARPLWPTPDTRGFTTQGSLEMLSKKAATKEEFDGMAYRKSKMFKDKMWPTPTAQDAKNNGGSSQHSRNTKPLNAEVGGSLNPQWVEWLMGYPIGWTDLGV